MIFIEDKLFLNMQLQQINQFQNHTLIYLFSRFSYDCSPKTIFFHYLHNIIIKSSMSLGTVADLVEYFNLNRQIFEKQKSNKEHMQRIMSMLSQQNMEILQKQFELYPRGLELPTFIYLMKKLYSPQNQISKYYFVSDLIKFFQAIDVNGDGHLEWSQFTQYIIENIRRVDRPNYKNKAFQQNQVISSAYSKVSNQYKITNIIDTGTANCIKKIVYVAREQKYYMLECASSIIRIFDAKFILVDYLQLKGEGVHSYISDFAFDKNNMIFAAIFENSARFCNLKVFGNVKTCNECQVNKLTYYHKVEYLPLHKYWAFLSKTGQLRFCTASYRSRTNLDFQVMAVLKHHEGLITDICQVEEPLYILTASMDGNVKFYSNSLKKSINLQHIPDQTNSAINSRYRKGILGIDYTREFGSYVLSYGFSSAIYIYNLQVSLTKGFSGKYKQHGGNLITARFLKAFPYVLSFDDKLNLRIWDFRYFQTIQIINCQKNFINPSRLQVIPQLSQCLVCEKRITQFRAASLQKKSKQINEFHVIFDFRMNTISNSLFLFTSNDVRVYNYNTGCLEKVFTHLTEPNFETNITACQFGYKGRKFFVGDAGGFVREYCSETGDFLQRIQPSQDSQYENKAIVSIIFLKEHSLLIVCSLDGRVLIYQRNSEGQFKLLRDLRQTHFELTCAQASSRYCTLATGSEDGSVNLWNLQKLCLEGVLVLRNKIVHVAFSPIHPILIVVEEIGVINLFHVRPCEEVTLRNHCFARVLNCDDLGSLQRINTVNFCLIIQAYINKKLALIGEEGQHHLLCGLGGDEGSIKVVNFTELLTHFNIQQNHQTCTIKKSAKCEIHSMKSSISTERKKTLVDGYSNDEGVQIEITKLIRQVCFSAHNLTVDKLVLVKQNAIILSTCEAEKKLKVWSLSGELNGIIDFFTFKKISWRVAEMNFHRKLQDIDTTIYSMKLIENKKLSAEEQEFIRINLLVNEYMNQSEKQDYFRWISMITRSRVKPKRTRKQIAVKKDDQIDVRDQIAKFNNLNAISESVSQDEGLESFEFNQIYNKLVNKIKNRLDKSELPCISRQETPQADQTLQRNHQKNSQINLNDFISTLRRTLRSHQEQEKKYEKDFALAMRKHTKTHKKYSNMLYRSLVDVRKNIQAVEKKHKKVERIL